MRYIKEIKISFHWHEKLFIFGHKLSMADVDLCSNIIVSAFIVMNFVDILIMSTSSIVAAIDTPILKDADWFIQILS